MEHVTNALSRLSSVLTKYIGMIIICFSVIAFFWRDGFAWTTNYTSIFLGVAMFGMGLTIHIGDFKVVFTRPKEIIIGFVAQYTIMPLIAWGLSVSFICQRISHLVSSWSDAARRNCQQCDHLYRRW